jgi:hypothetical protein
MLQDVAEADLLNVIQFVKRGSIICFDDSDFPGLRVLLNMYMLTGKITNIIDQVGFIQNFSQMFFINSKQSSNHEFATHKNLREKAIVAFSSLN